MKLEFLAEGAAECPLLRLFDFSAAEAARLLAAIKTLADSTSAAIELHCLPFVESVAGCRMTLMLSDWDEGVVIGEVPRDCRCGLTATSWSGICDLIEPFTQGGSGYQWLASTPGEAALLMSVTGEW